MIAVSFVDITRIFKQLLLPSFTYVIQSDSPEKPAEPEGSVRKDPCCKFSQSFPVQH